MDEVVSLIEEHRVIAVVTELFNATDRRDWAAVVDCFAPEVLFDMTSLTGGAPARLPPTEIAAGWERGLAPIQSVHHQAGNFRVTLRGDAAEAFCYAIALHHLPNPSGRNTRMFVGSYDVGLRRDAGRWRIDRFRFDVKFVDGNLELEKAR